MDEYDEVHPDQIRQGRDEIGKNNPNHTRMRVDKIDAPQERRITGHVVRKWTFDGIDAQRKPQTTSFRAGELVRRYRHRTIPTDLRATPTPLPTD